MGNMTLHSMLHGKKPTRGRGGMLGSACPGWYLRYNVLQAFLQKLAAIGERNYMCCNSILSLVQFLFSFVLFYVNIC